MKKLNNILLTERQFRKEKRKQFNNFKKHFESFTLGCAYIPSESYLKVVEIDNLLNDVNKELKMWWKKS